jgi:hypothetical protein
MRAADIAQAAPAGWGPIRVNVSPATSIRVVPIRVAPIRVAPIRVAPIRVAPIRVAPIRVAPIRVAPIRVRLSRPGRLSATSAESN